MAKKPKFEKLAINLSRSGELRYETAYNARDAARIATKWARKGWDVEVKPWEGRQALMTCAPSARKKWWADPDPKAHAICKLTPAFKKRVRMKK